MLYLKIVLASSKFSSSPASLSSSTPSSSAFSASFFFFLSKFTFGVSITTYLASMMFTLSKDFSLKGLPKTKYIYE